MHPTTRWLRDLVSIGSVNPMGRALQGPDLYEHRVTDYLEQQFRELGVRYERQPVAPLRENIVAYYEPAGATSTLVFEVHQDTVPTDHMTIDPFGAEIRDGKLYGRGACDVKGGMASMLGAFARLVKDNPAGSARVILACTVDEEFTFLGVQRFVQDDLRSVHRHIAAVVAEPTGLDIVHAHKGAVRWHLRTSGRSCHSSRPELGVNAIYHMATLLGHVERFAADLRDRPAHPLLGLPTLSVGRIEGGTSVNTVPDRCHVEIDRRTLPGEKTPAIAGELDAYLRHHVSGLLDFTSGEPYLSCPALGNEGSEDLVARLTSVIDDVSRPPRVMAVPYGTDASSIAEAGIPVVVFGPGSIDQAHTCDEWIDLSEVEAAGEILYRLAQEMG